MMAISVAMLMPVVCCFSQESYDCDMSDDSRFGTDISRNDTLPSEELSITENYDEIGEQYGKVGLVLSGGGAKGIALSLIHI